MNMKVVKHGSMAYNVHGRRWHSKFLDETTNRNTKWRFFVAFVIVVNLWNNLKICSNVWQLWKIAPNSHYIFRLDIYGFIIVKGEIFKKTWPCLIPRKCKTKVPTLIFRLENFKKIVHNQIQTLNKNHFKKKIGSYHLIILNVFWVGFNVFFT